MPLPMPTPAMPDVTPAMLTNARTELYIADTYGTPGGTTWIPVPMELSTDVKWNPNQNVVSKETYAVGGGIGGSIHTMTGEGATINLVTCGPLSDPAIRALITQSRGGYVAFLLVAPDGRVRKGNALVKENESDLSPRNVHEYKFDLMVHGTYQLTLPA